MTSRPGRPMTILLLALWFYAFVFLANGAIGFQASLAMTLAAFSLAVLLMKADGVTAASLTVAGLLLVSFGAQLAFWLIPGVSAQFAQAFYFVGSTVATAQFGVMAVDAVRLHLKTVRRRRFRRLRA
ncbi:hypothetical protein LTR94_025560 [Friedmanniomyces endolithicus]|nr:hypothetical protein LTR94_025560 [Friedmanniomyces endolithicus]